MPAWTLRSLAARTLYILFCGALCGGLAAMAAEPMPGFRDRTKDFGIEIGNGAACWVDLNNDGWVDLCAGGTVWRNKAGKGFEKLADGLGEVVAADFDNDGFADLFSWNSLRAYSNAKGKSFLDHAVSKLPNCVSRGACWGDFNNDGFVDIYVGGFEDWDKDITYPNLILMNDKGTAFELGWNEVRNRSRGVTACDFDEDGDLDIYVSNYRLQPNLLWINDGTGKFKDEADKYNAVATSPGFPGGHSIGAAWGDFDNDGRFDLFAGNFAHVDGRGDQPKSRFLRNLGPEKSYTFDDKGTCGVFYQESYASPAAADYDNDGDLDLFFTTIYGTASFNKPNHPVLYRNDGNFTFADATAAAGVASLPPTYQAAWADFDNDGDLDLVTAGQLFENVSAQGHWLELRLEGDGKKINRRAIGAQVRVKLPDRTITRQVEAGTGEGNQNDLTLHFGLGQHANPVSVEIRWPNGTRQTIDQQVLDRVVTVTFDQPK